MREKEEPGISVTTVALGRMFCFGIGGWNDMVAFGLGGWRWAAPRDGWHFVYMMDEAG